MYSWGEKIAEVAARLPSIVAAGLVAAMIAFVSETYEETGSRQVSGSRSSGRFLGRSRSPFTFLFPVPVAAFLFVTTPGCLAWGSVAVADMVFLCTITASILCFFVHFHKGMHSTGKEQEGEQDREGEGGLEGQRVGFLCCALLAALSCLTKGPLGPLVISLTLMLFVTATGHARKTFHLLPWRGMAAVFLLVSAPWYVLMTLLHGNAYLNTFFGYHHFDRYLTGVNWHGNRPWVLMILTVSFPWGLVLAANCKTVLKDCLGGMKLKLRQQRSTQQQQQSPSFPLRVSLQVLCACWILAVMLILCPSASQLPSYYLPLLPPLCITVGRIMRRNCEGTATQIAVAASYLSLGLLLLVAPSELSKSADFFTSSLGHKMMADFWRYKSVGFSLVLGSILILAQQAIPIPFSPKKRRRTKALGEIEGKRGEGEGVDASKGDTLWLLTCVPMLLFGLFGFQSIAKVHDNVRQKPLRLLCEEVVRTRKPGEAIAAIDLQMPSIVYYTGGNPVAFFPDLAVATREASRAKPPVTTLFLAHADRVNEVARRMEVMGRRKDSHMLPYAARRLARETRRKVEVLPSNQKTSMSSPSPSSSKVDNKEEEGYVLFRLRK